MKLAIMQPYFLPYIGYFQLINSVDRFISYDNVSYTTRSWINRNRVLIRSGSIAYITVPVKHSGSDTYIHSIRIDNSQNWRQRILRTLYLNYRYAPFFEESFPLMEKLLIEHYDMISALNRKSLALICRHLGIDTLFIDDSGRYSAIEEQLKTAEASDKKHSRIISICKQEMADIYVNAIGGEKLYSKDIFMSEKINLLFIKTGQFRYNQNQSIFHPNLSIIDVLMYAGVKKTKEFLNLYELV